MTQRVGKCVSHSAREKWRIQWAAKLFSLVQPALSTGGDRVTADQPAGKDGRWEVPGAVVGIGAALVPAAE